MNFYALLYDSENAQKRRSMTHSEVMRESPMNGGLRSGKEFVPQDIAVRLQNIKQRANGGFGLFGATEVVEKPEIAFLRTVQGDIPKYTGEFWTAKQRQAHAIHEISYRACFKPQLPHFFIDWLTGENDIVYDPFSGRGTTAIEAALMGRRFVANDANPLSTILARPRVRPPKMSEIERRLMAIDLRKHSDCEIDLSMFFHEETLGEICALRDYLQERKVNGQEDFVDEWIRMVATNRLTGHSAGFFSVYTLPPNQAASPSSQIKINQRNGVLPEKRDVKKIILKKSQSLLADIKESERKRLFEIAARSAFISGRADGANGMENDSVDLTVTSPPFLNIVQYAQDNWMRCWFNHLDAATIANNIVMAKTLKEWEHFIERVFEQLFAVTKKGGYVAFEVGEIDNGQVNLEESVAKIGIKVGFSCLCIIVNAQQFTKTANIWGISNNSKGTNSNRIVIFTKA